MRKLLRSKKREALAEEDLGPSNCAGASNSTAEFEETKTTSDTEALADQNSKTNLKLGVRVLYEPSDRTVAVIE